MDEVGRRPGYRRQAGARSPRALPVREREMALATCSCWAAQRRAQPLDMSEAHEVTGEPNGEPTETDARRRQATPSDYRCSSTAHQATSSDVRRRAGNAS